MVNLHRFVLLLKKGRLETGLMRIARLCSRRQSPARLQGALRREQLLEADQEHKKEGTRIIQAAAAKKELVYGRLNITADDLACLGRILKRSDYTGTVST